jgi:type I site-specific restriction endonuclease
MEASLSDPGTLNMAEAVHDKGRSALVDKFKEREERWRREQALHSQQSQQAPERGEHEADAKQAERDDLADRLQSAAQGGAEPPSAQEAGKGGAL